MSLVGVVTDTGRGHPIVGMLAAMPQPPSAASRDEPVIRERGDACPGALRLHAADDGFLARVRVPAGLLTVEQASALALAADRFGDGHLELTSRGNVQLRGLADGCGAGLAELLDRAGLLPAPSHERVRNIVATPLSGLDGPDRPDASAWAVEFDRLLCAAPWAAALSGRFLFAFDDGRGDVAALAPDVTVLGRSRGRALVRLGRSDDAVELAGQDAPRAALLAARYFLDAAAEAGTQAWRVAELPAEHALDEVEFVRRLDAAGIAAETARAVDRPYAPPPRPSRTGGHDRATLCVLPRSAGSTPPSGGSWWRSPTRAAAGCASPRGAASSCPRRVSGPPPASRRSAWSSPPTVPGRTSPPVRDGPVARNPSRTYAPTRGPSPTGRAVRCPCTGPAASAAAGIRAAPPGWIWSPPAPDTGSPHPAAPYATTYGPPNLPRHSRTPAPTPT